MLLPLLLAAACSGEDELAAVHAVVTHDSAVPYREDGPDVVLIVLDTLRADRLSQYGYKQATSPGLDRLAATSTRFANAYAPSPWTVPSTTSVLTGQHPLRHGMRHPGDVIASETPMLAEQLRGAGWHTVAWSYNVSVAPKHGYDRGFDQFTSNTGKVLAYPHAARMTADADEWLKAHPDDPTFLYLQPMNCHGPYKVPKDRQDDLLGRAPGRRFTYYGPVMKAILKGGDLAARDKVSKKTLKSLKEQYDTAIRYETDEVGKLLADLEAAGRYDNALVILTSDHGEELFEHGGFSHGYSLHDEVLHVPLFVKLPGQKEGRVVETAVSTMDITPTILDVLGLAGPPVDGSSLRAAAAGETVAARDQLFDVDWKKRIVAKGVLSQGWKLIRTVSDYQGRKDHIALFNLAEDPHEKEDLSAVEAMRAADLEALLGRLSDTLTGSVAPANVLSDMDHAQLEALGYLE
jgi:arylsulfatase A-like enzyme